MVRRIESALLAVACVIPFVRLGIGEIQPWDESLYVIRATACLKFGAWLDQTKYAVGGLYSAWHPPFGIWLIAFSKYFLGDGTFVARLPAALAASGSVLLLWFFVRRFVSATSALVAAVSLSAADLFLLYSHRAQLETFLLFFTLATLLFLLRAIERSSWRQAILGGIFFGLALQVKIGYALYSLPMFLLLPWAMGRPRDLRYPALAFASGFLLALPWFVMMSLHHPNYWPFVTHSLSTFQRGTYAPSSVAWWFYANRLIIALPLIVVIIFVRRWDKPSIAALIWLLSVAILLQVFGTRMAHFAFLLLAPGAVLVGMGWDRVKRLEPRWRAAAMSLVVLLIAWSASEQVRLLLTHRIQWSDVIARPAGIITIGIAVVLAGIALTRIKSTSRYAIAFCVILLGIALSHLLSQSDAVYENGAANISALVDSLSTKTTMVVIHPDFPHELYAPQLAFYTGGWTLGWIPGKTSRSITWDSAATPAYFPDSTREIAVITRFENRFFHPPDLERALWNSLTQKLRQSFSNERVFRSYVVFY